MKWQSIIFITVLLAACGSNEIIRSKDICTVKKHVKDDLYQVRLNERPVNNRWYLEKDAKIIKLVLATRNKCMR